MERVVLKGVDSLKKEEKYQVNKIINPYLEKIKRNIKNDFTLEIMFKEYKTQGKKDKAHKFSIQADVVTSIRKLEAHASDWDLNRTLHSVLKKILEEIEHNYHVSNQK